MTDDILYRYIKGETTAEEDSQVTEWVKEAPQTNQRTLKGIRFIYEFSELHGREAAKAAESMHGLQRLPLRRVGHYALRFAVAVLLVIGTGYLTKTSIYDDISQHPIVYQVPNGQRVHITLSDGSKVWLNSGTTLEYPAVFCGKLRQVKLEGEAMFEVEHDARRPFRVETFASNIEVLGTKFNVMADKACHQFTTTLLQGKVKVENKLAPNSPDIIMKPNDIVTLSNKHLFVEQVKDTDALCWTEGLVSISGYTFDKLMAKFEQAFDVKIVIFCKSLPDIRDVSGKVRVSDGIDDALRVLQFVAPFSFTRDIETNVITIY